MRWSTARGTRCGWSSSTGAGACAAATRGRRTIRATTCCTSPVAQAEYLAFLQRERIPYLIAGQERVDLAAAMRKLKTELGVTCVRSTAGARLNGALLRAGLLDEVNIIYRPELIGGTETPTLFDSPELAPDEWPTKLRLVSALVRGEGHVWLRYEVRAI
jgi:riboflavin biosynthesis pyrimidine reductase